MCTGCEEETGVVVSLALVKAREPNLRKVIKNLVNQSVKPDRIHIWISKDSFYLDEGFKKKPELNFPRAKIHWTENIGGARKFIPVLKKYWGTNQKIILTDDDHIWHKDMIKDVLKYSDIIDGVLATAGNFYRDKDPNNWRKKWFHGDTVLKPVRCDIISTGYGCLIRPSNFTLDIFDLERYKKYGVPYDDEFWFSAMLAKNGITRWVVPTSTRRNKIEHHGVDMFKNKKSRQCKAMITKQFKRIIMKTGEKSW